MRRRSLFAVALVCFAACNPRNPQASSATATPNPQAPATGIPLTVTGNGSDRRPIRFVEQKNNRRYYELTAKSFQSKGAPGSVLSVFYQTSISFHAKDGQLLNATAPTAVVDQSTDTVTLSGGVHATNAAGMTLSCDTLTYDRKTEMVHGFGHVVIDNPNGFHGTGSRFASDVSLTHSTMQ